MVFLDNAATSYHKPPSVYRAVRDAMGSRDGGVIQLIMDGSKVAEVVSSNINGITRRTGRCPILV